MIPTDISILKLYLLVTQSWMTASDIETLKLPAGILLQVVVVIRCHLQSSTIKRRFQEIYRFSIEISVGCVIIERKYTTTRFVHFAPRGGLKYVACLICYVWSIGHLCNKGLFNNFREMRYMHLISIENTLTINTIQVTCTG